MPFPFPPFIMPFPLPLPLPKPFPLVVVFTLVETVEVLLSEFVAGVVTPQPVATKAKVTIADKINRFGILLCFFI
ncbi:MAG: hypothetical protein COX80_03230 [Candidatus Magasanikbacteria bacterium CG_4_10_14_0_2_um_filter_33_14]|uniref:Uncharacterized protein n=1 Tax=Candidatus Magasanikbacteria bacterium CG_4_10_14_0_2_um_filter_33_14 TaxID=1974636 RepID=A0A2M7VAD1_9BACT|nr:MAG: hypothetical protein COX80_03230 [Candidatus Magasanikbacteria bacterium CG_4_10_14_0_2_um_filter_33_14]